MNVAINSRISLPKIQSPHLDAIYQESQTARTWQLEAISKKETHAWKTELSIPSARVILELSLLTYAEQADRTTIKRRINCEASYSISLYFLIPPTLSGN